MIYPTVPGLKVCPQCLGSGSLITRGSFGLAVEPCRRCRGVGRVREPRLITLAGTELKRGEL